MLKTFAQVTVALSMNPTDEFIIEYIAPLLKVGLLTKVDFVHVSTDKNSQNSKASIQALVEKHIPSNLSSQFSYHLREGVIIDELISFLIENQSGLIMLGHRSSVKGKRALARQLAMISPASVWMVPNKSNKNISTVIAPVDFSSHSADSLSIATGICEKLSIADCIALHVSLDAALLTPEDVGWELARDKKTLEAFLRPLSLHGRNVIPVMVDGINVSQSVMQVVEDKKADLIVLSTRGRSKAASVLLGSEASQLFSESNVPVLAVKHRGSKLDIFGVLSDAGFWKKKNPKTN